MLDKLFRSRAVVQRHLGSPLLQERLEYLQHCANQGYSLTTFRELAADLLLIQNPSISYVAFEPTKAFQSLRCRDERHITGFATKRHFCCP
jgi:hypothetical protein